MLNTSLPLLSFFVGSLPVLVAMRQYPSTNGDGASKLNWFDPKAAVAHSQTASVPKGDPAPQVTAKSSAQPPPPSQPPLPQPAPPTEAPKKAPHKSHLEEPTVGSSAPTQIDSGWDMDFDIDGDGSLPDQPSIAGVSPGSLPDQPSIAGVSPELLAKAKELLATQGAEALQGLVQKVAADADVAAGKMPPSAAQPPTQSCMETRDSPSLSSAAGSSAASAEASGAANSSVGRSLNALEVARSVDEAMKFKEELANQSIKKAREDVLAKRQALQQRLAEEDRLLREEEAKLVQMQAEIHKGSDTERAKIEKFRSLIEAAHREIVNLERDTAAKKVTMERAVAAYKASDEQLVSKKEARRILHEEMTELILSQGKAKDERLNRVLCDTPAG